jgi:GNAT superfamily N-acetyltransferase
MARFRASDVVVAGGVDLEALRLVLPRVDPRSVRIWVGPWWFRMFWGREIAAVAMAWGIYVRPDIMRRFAEGREPARNATLIVHELAHLEQWRRLGVIRHSVQYLFDYVRGLAAGKGTQGAYRAIRLEVEARQTARLVMAMSRPS